jgi:hypothetical protein
MSGSLLPLRFAPLFLLAAMASLLGACASQTASPELTAAEAPRPSMRHDDFNVDARTALNAASHGLKTCKTTQGPQKLDATLVFHPSGRVTHVDVEPKGPEAECVRDKLAHIEVLPFGGSPVTMRTIVKL